MARWLAISIFHLDGVVLDHGSHESVISLLLESVWDDSLISSLGIRVSWGESVNVRQLQHGPVVVEVAGESAVWVSILWHWASDVGLWVFLETELHLSPIIVEMAGESAIGMSVLWHWSPNIWLRILT